MSACHRCHEPVEGVVDMIGRVRYECACPTREQRRAARVCLDCAGPVMGQAHRCRLCRDARTRRVWAAQRRARRKHRVRNQCNQCGRVTTAWKRFCPPCQLERRRASWRDYRNRHLAERRAADRDAMRRHRTRLSRETLAILNRKRALARDLKRRPYWCHACGDVLPYQGMGAPRKWCDGCVPTSHKRRTGLARCPGCQDRDTQGAA